ncbi:quaternary amine ABC transporter ATP-binding protein [Paracoccus luteus]|uniref:quaternary amine ABC transporter ATP-binding protein n=1 Tax=Paracoccus luteus TaxID=2508543 RepID=UPI0010706237|nr:glycine betaine/L-proline ABC transporter ATP-binding protein [Paracoccus luteus]
MSEPLAIEIRNLYKIFGARPRAHVDAVRQGMTKAQLNERHRHVLGLRDINLSVAPGSIQVVMGLSGSGKSTLIRHINRLIEPTVGEIVIDGRDVVTMTPAELRRFRRLQTAMVFQKFALLPHRTVLDNVSYGLEVQGVARADRHRTAMRWVQRVGLGGYETRYPSQLSGGMQQRVGLARALANDAPILLMDEAYSALDPLIRHDMQTVLLDLQKEVRKTIVFITHDFDEALRIGDRIALLRDGSIIQQGTGQEMVLRPADDYVSSFVQHVDRARIVRVDSVMLPLTDDAGGPRVGATTSLGEAIRTMSAEGSDRVTVLDEGGRPVGTVPMTRAVAVAAGGS